MIIYIAIDLQMPNLPVAINRCALSPMTVPQSLTELELRNLLGQASDRIPRPASSKTSRNSTVASGRIQVAVSYRNK